MNTITETAKIKVFSNDRQIEDKKSDVELSLKLIKELIEHYTALEITLSDDEYNTLIQGNFQDTTIQRLADQRALKVPMKQKKDVMIEFIDDVRNHIDIFHTTYLILSPDIEVKKGKAYIKNGAFDIIEARYTQHISDPESISLFDRHNQLIKMINDLKDDLNARTNGSINSSYLVHFDAVGDAYRPVPINYGN